MKGRVGEDEEFMRAALSLARRATGKTSPNPLVGCVIAKGSRVLGRGFHKAFGKPHAEAAALKNAGRASLKGATLYVNLEPCVWHEGKKTPSCARAIANAGADRVVIAQRDPNPLTRGKGIALLRNAGVKVEVGVLGGEAAELNEAYCKFISRRIPFVVLKMACTLDGKIASQKTKIISNPAALRLAQELRNKYDAILVGAGTVLEDDPRLTCRLAGGRDPLRVVVDSRLRARPDARVFGDANAIVFCGENAPRKKAAALLRKGIRVITIPLTGGKVDLRKAVELLGKMGVSSILVEGGSGIATSMLKEGLVDKAMIVVAPKIFGKGVPIVGEWLASELELADARVSTLGDNAVFEGRPARKN